MRSRLLLRIILLAISVPSTALAQSDSQSPAALAFFEKRVRPILAEHCYACHSGRAEKLRGDLRLDRGEHVLRGGESGPAVIPGNPTDSMLIKAVRYESLRMPPNRRLAQRDIDLLVQWVRIGAPFPMTPGGERGDGAVAVDRRVNLKISAADREYWAYQPIRKPPIPAVRDASRVANPIDAFVLNRLEQAGARPNSAATPRQLVRRLSYDLTGLPPDIAAIEQFVDNPSDEAWSRLIAELISRPTYGERWGRYWLDVVRYAQTNGYERDGEKPFAWRYRDYVIRSFNEDKPFDRFIIEQLAGDELKGAGRDAIIATAFYRLGVWDDEPDDALAAEFDGLDDILSTIGQAFLGHTVGCARCHNHRFDPLSQRDYYQLLAFIGNVKPYEKPRYRLDSAIFAPLADPAVLNTWHQQQAAKVAALEQQRQQLADDKQAGHAELDMKLAALRETLPPFEWTLAVRERVKVAQPTHVLIRGDPRTPGERVEAGFPEIFESTEPDAVANGQPGRRDISAGRGRRLARSHASTNREL